MSRAPKVLIDEATIANRVNELAEEISRDYDADDEILLVGVLRGCFIFLADLARRLSVPRRIDFISVQSYQGAKSGAVRMLMDVRTDIAGKHVLIVEDIVDTGQTLAYLLDVFGARHPASVKTCVFVRKERSQQVEGARIDYLGLEIPDVWVVGYGLDYNDHYRTLPYIGVVEPIGD